MCEANIVLKLEDGEGERWLQENIFKCSFLSQCLLMYDVRVTVSILFSYLYSQYERKEMRVSVSFIIKLRVYLSDLLT